jgi:hypothetical protein
VCLVLGAIWFFEYLTGVGHLQGPTNQLMLALIQAGFIDEIYFLFDLTVHYETAARLLPLSRVHVLPFCDRGASPVSLVLDLDGRDATERPLAVGAVLEHDAVALAASVGGLFPHKAALEKETQNCFTTHVVTKYIGKGERLNQSEPALLISGFFLAFTLHLG